MSETISKLDVDYDMCKDQLAALDSKPVYKVRTYIVHPDPYADASKGKGI